MTTTSTAIDQPMIAVCANGHTVRGAWNDMQKNSGIYLICPCGARGAAKSITYKHKEAMACGARCTDATGPTCSCSCDGRRHGMDKAFTA